MVSIAAVGSVCGGALGSRLYHTNQTAAHAPRSPDDSGTSTGPTLEQIAARASELVLEELDRRRLKQAQEPRAPNDEAKSTVAGPPRAEVVQIKDHIEFDREQTENEVAHRLKYKGKRIHIRDAEVHSIGSGSMETTYTAEDGNYRDSVAVVRISARQDWKSFYYECHVRADQLGVVAKLKPNMKVSVEGILDRSATSTLYDCVLQMQD
ncbi:MAG: hypothetical protein ACYTGZ_19410 [Planctomycetota bacterium]